MFLSRLAELAGPSHVIERSGANRHVSKLTARSPAPLCVLPRSEEVAEIVKFAAAEKLAIVPRGARTKLGIGMPPRKYDLALDMTRMDRIARLRSGRPDSQRRAGNPSAARLPARSRNTGNSCRSPSRSWIARPRAARLRRALIPRCGRSTARRATSFWEWSSSPATESRRRAAGAW